MHPDPRTVLREPRLRPQRASGASTGARSPAKLLYPHLTAYSVSYTWHQEALGVIFNLAATHLIPALMNRGWISPTGSIVRHNIHFAPLSRRCEVEVNSRVFPMLPCRTLELSVGFADLATAGTRGEEGTKHRQNRFDQRHRVCLLIRLCSLFYGEMSWTI